MKDATSLKALFLSYNWFEGSIPSTIVSLPQLTTLGLFSNYLTGTMPIPSTSLLALDVGFNYLSGTFPKLSLAVCAADQNCFLNSSFCRTYGSLQRTATACSICGTTNGQGTLVRDAIHQVIPRKSAASCSICGTTNAVGPMCWGAGGECVAAAASYIAAGTLNTVANAAAPPMLCSVLLTLKAALGVNLLTWAASTPCQVAGKQVPAGPQSWSGVLCGDTGDVVSISLASQRLSGSIPTDISKLTTLTYLDFGYNLFQSTLVGLATPVSGMTSLKALGLSSNYLTGTIPPLPTSLVSLDVAFNFLSGSFPKIYLAFCAADQNCFLNSSNCRALSSLQRPATACAICGTNDGQGTLCGSGLCAPNSGPYASIGTVNVASLPPVSMACQGYAPLVLMNAASALLALKVSLGVTFTTWAATVPCQIVGKQAATQTTWSGVLCTDTGDVLSISVARQSLYSNYLTGTMPTLTTSLVALDVGFNYLSGSFPKLSLASCAADQNCFVSSSYCRTYSLQQRPATACGICGTTDGQGTLCGGALCSANSSLPVSQGIVNVPTLTPVALTCSALLALKVSLGVTFTTWAASVPCQVVGKQAATQTTWSGVLCTDTGDVLSISVARQSLKGSIASDISKLTALTYLGLYSNYLTGTMPTLTTSLVALDVGFNYLSGSFPKLSLASCAADQNCFVSSSYCRTYSSQQRPATACGICGTTDGQGTLCGGALCSANSSLPVSQGIVNVPTLTPVALTCSGNAPLVLMTADSGGPNGITDAPPSQFLHSFIPCTHQSNPLLHPRIQFLSHTSPFNLSPDHA
ncbi:unnamed protein product [Closterium sp. Naga37s-1]|nr:unnamed protein product [Closterium sp. Naga37s-1]